jgi:two-component system sensor histidine kinase TctE
VIPAPLTPPATPGLADPADSSVTSPAEGGHMLSGLRRRLLVLILGPLLLLAFTSAWLEYQAAGSVTELQDQQLLALQPLMADSVIPAGEDARGPTLLMLAPEVEQFLAARPGTSAYAIQDAVGRLLHGEEWLVGPGVPSRLPEFGRDEHQGMTWRILRQRHPTATGELTITLADASNPQQRWARAILLKVLLPHLVIIAAAAVAVHWAVDRALRPLLELTEVVERRSPQDLSAIDLLASPREVRPLIAALNRLFGLVEAQAEGQRRFIADAAHQLRTPLAGLQAQVEAWAQAARRISPPGGRGTMLVPVEQIEKLRSATRRTSQLANQLLALSRADARSMTAQPMERVELKPMCESLLESFLDAASAKQIDLGLEAQPAAALGYEWLLRELLANLVDNAVKYTPEGRTVTIRCGPAERGAFVEVEDDGRGVAPEDLPHLFDRFYRVPGTQGEGTGLGLAIAQEIARVHHSQLQLESGTGGRGLRVTLRLPA